MAHGHPDYGTDAPLSTVYSLQDMAELAARLGSIVTFDRRGNVILLDSFESGIEQWYLGPSGYTGSLTWSSDHHHSGGFCGKLATGAAVGNIMEMWRFMAYPVASKFGFECSFAWETGLRYVTFNLVLDTLTNYWFSKIRYDSTNKTLEYWDLAGGWTELATGLTLVESLYQFHTCKLVIDGENGEYTRFILNNTTYDLSAIPIQDVGPGSSPKLQIGIVIQDRLTGSYAMCIDDVILTQNEL